MTSTIMCQNCGTVYGTFDENSSVFSMTWGSQWPLLIDLLINPNLSPKCRSCHRAIEGLSSVVAIVFDDHRCAVFFAPGLDERDRGQLCEAAKLVEVEAIVVDSIEGVRAEISDHVLQYKPLLHELMSAAMADELADFLLARWNDYSPDALAAQLVASTGMIKGIGVDMYDAESREEVTDVSAKLNVVQSQLASAQHRILTFLAATAPSLDQPFEDVLARHIDRAWFYNDVVERVFDSTSHMIENSADTLSSYDLYRLEALIASVHATAGHDNPRAGQWASRFFSYERYINSTECDDSDPLLAGRVGEARACATISYENAYNVVARILAKEVTREGIDSLQAAAKRAGYEALVSDVLGNLRIEVRGSDRPGVATILGTALALARKQDDDPKFLMTVARGTLAGLTANCDADEMQELAARIQSELPQSHESQAQVDAWYGEWAKETRQPSRLFDRIGEEPRDWEYDLPLNLRLNLWNERANAWRLLSQPHLALEITDVLLAEAVGEEFENQRKVLQRNRAILLRDVGQLDQSLKQLKEMAKSSTPDELGPIHHSKATTLVSLGRIDEAIDCYEQALKTPISGRFRSIAEFSLAQAFANAGDFRGSLAILDKFAGFEHDGATLALECSARFVIYWNGSDDDPNRSRLQQLAQQLDQTVEAVKDSGDARSVAGLLKIRAMLAMCVDADAEIACWLELLDTQMSNDEFPSPIAIAMLAAVWFEQGKQEEAQEFLDMLAHCVVDQFGGVSEIDIAANSTHTLGIAFDRLARAVLKRDEQWADVRRVSEFRRDLIGRAQLLARLGEGSEALLDDDIRIDDVALAKLAPERGTLGILDWMDDGRSIVGMLTTLTSNGALQTRFIDAPPVDIRALRVRIGSRLAGWHARRRGDPFDMDEWQSLEQWVQTLVRAYLADDDHLLIIEHEDYMGLPWHVALAGIVTCSYAPSWMSVVAMPAPRATYANPLSIVSAPRYRDPAVVVAAMERSTQRTLDWARGHGIVVNAFLNAEADKVALRRSLEESETVKILCHGFVRPDDHEVAFVVSGDGQLPPVYPTESNLFSWRDCIDLESAPRCMFSGGCSSGTRWEAGMGEHMGLFSALRRSGLRSLVAPRWDVTGDAVLPILDDSMHRYLERGAGLSRCLADACEHAARTTPHWLAWSLAVEGDWR